MENNKKTEIKNIEKDLAKPRTKKAKKIIVSLGILSLLGVIAYVGIFTYQTIIKYNDVWNADITQSEVDEKEKEIQLLTQQILDIENEQLQADMKIDNEIRSLEHQLTARESEYNESIKRHEDLNALIESSQISIDDILDLYERNMVIIDEAKIAILNGLGHTIDSSYQFSQEEARKEWRNEIINELAGNSLVSSGIQGGLDAISEG
jgi:hypothetical protein